MLRGDARPSPESGCGVKADGAGTATRASRSPALSPRGVAGACGGSLSSRLLRRGVAATGEGTAAGSSVAEAWTSMSRGDRVTPVRARDRRDFGGVDADSLEESALSVDGDESAGAAHAVPPPLMATPTPSTTAKPPTRPTNAEALNCLDPLGRAGNIKCQQTQSSQMDSLKRKLRTSLIACASNTLFHRKQCRGRRTTRLQRIHVRHWFHPSYPRRCRPDARKDR